MLKCTLLAGVAIIAISQAAHAAAPVVVGTCDPTKTSFNTIQGAVDAAASTGNTQIQVCPGQYPEQVSITKNVTLTGLTQGNLAQAAIVAPSGGIVANTTSPFDESPVAAQIFVSAGAKVTLSNLTVDGSNNGLADCATDLVGILYRNASGTIKSSHILNQTLAGGLAGCQSGLGIYVQSSGGGTSTVTVTGNNVENYQKNGITGNETGTVITISNNTVIGQGATTGAAENSIQIGFGATGSVSGNTVGDDVWAPDVFGDTGNAAAGILLYLAGATPVTNNIVSATQYGIVVEGDSTGAGDGATVSGNKVYRTHLYDGIDICGASNTMVKTNTINGSDEAAVHIDSSCGNNSLRNSVTTNKVNGACTGVLVGPGSESTVSANTISNAPTVLTTGSDVCPASAAASVRVHSAKHKARAVRF